MSKMDVVDDNFFPVIVSVCIIYLWDAACFVATGIGVSFRWEDFCAIWTHRHRDIACMRFLQCTPTPTGFSLRGASVFPTPTTTRQSQDMHVLRARLAATLGLTEFREHTSLHTKLATEDTRVERIERKTAWDKSLGRPTRKVEYRGWGRAERAERD